MILTVILGFWFCILMQIQCNYDEQWLYFFGIALLFFLAFFPKKFTIKGIP
jgi:Na+/H+ antiporter NhaC